MNFVSLKGIFLIICICLSLNCLAQTTDFGVIVGAEYSADLIRNFDASLCSEIKTGNNFFGFDRMKVSLGMDYSLLRNKSLKIGAGFDYIRKNELKYFGNRYRANLSILYNYKIRNFKLSYRVRGQVTFYDEERSYHKFNPKTYLRNKFEFTYSFFGKPIKIFTSTEFFLRLYRKGSFFVDSWRTIAGVNYRFDKRNSIDIFLRADNEVQVKNRANVYYLGVGYNFE